MAVEVKIPTILRTYTGGAKTVTAAGGNLSALLDDLEANHAGLKARLITDDGSLHRFVNIYVNDEDVRFTGSLDTAITDGDSVTILPAVAGGSRSLLLDGHVIAGGSRSLLLDGHVIAGGSRSLLLDGHVIAGGSEAAHQNR
jgi:molybdopterin synthase sulfur carrier subunit